jgi:hypothetical protein
MHFLERMRKRADWQEWQTPAETFQVGDQVHFILSLTFDKVQEPYCFSFIIENDCWYFQHLETINLRLDQIPPLPTSAFPDIDEPQKAWIRQEIAVSEQIRLYTFLKAEKGQAFAMEWFKDGAGYTLAARAWIPFVVPQNAFILYLCWEQANLRGNKVTLHKLNPREALVEIKPVYLRLYHETGHLSLQIQWEEYLRLFESIWQDRAAQAGWELVIRYNKDACLLNFNR